MNNLAEKKESALSLKDVMRSAVQKEATPSKSKTPVLNVSDKVQKLAETVWNAKIAMETAENEFARLAKELTDEIAPLRIALCQKEFVPTVKVPAGKHMVAITWSSNYKKISNTNEPELIRVMGSKEEYDRNFFSKFKIYADDKSEKELYDLFCMLAPNDGETAEDVAIGQSRFANYFKVEETIRPYEAFVRSHLFMSEEKRADLELCGVVQFMPSVKTR